MAMKESSSTMQEELPLAKAAQLLLEECRMVLPGIQALFGFQLIAVFQSRFAELLSPLEQRLHLVAIGLTAVAVALIMAPAAYHRQACAQKLTQRFIRVSSRLVLWSMPPLAVSLCVELYLLSRIILNVMAAGIVATLLFAVFFALWFVFPRLQRKERDKDAVG
jgi:hypothetical protein